MTDKTGKNSPPENKKAKVAEVKSVKVSGSHGAFSDNKTRWTYPPTAPPQAEDKIIELPKKHFIEEELEILKKWVTEAAPWSIDKNQALNLLSIIVRNEKIPLKFRTIACVTLKNGISEPIVSTNVK